MRLCPSCFTLNPHVLNVQFVNNHKSEVSNIFYILFTSCVPLWFVPLHRFHRFALIRQKERSLEHALLPASVLLQVMLYIYLWKKETVHPEDESDIFFIASIQRFTRFPMTVSVLFSALIQLHCSWWIKQQFSALRRYTEVALNVKLISTPYFIHERSIFKCRLLVDSLEKTVTCRHLLV